MSPEKRGFCEALTGRITAIAAILEVGPNYFVTEYVQADERQLSGLRPYLAARNFLPVWAITQCRDLIKAFRRQGYETELFAA